MKSLFLLLLVSLTAFPQTRLPGPNPAEEKVIRPGKLIGAPKEANPPDGGTGDTPATNPGGPGNPGPGNPGPGNPGSPAGAPAPPASLTAGPGLRIARWTTFRRITKFTAADPKHIAQLRISADGGKLAFASAQGTYTLNADGSNLVQLSAKPNNNPGVVDISADGKKVFWTDINEREAFVANSDGTGRIKLPLTNHVSSARITADGKRVFALSVEGGGILSLPSDGSDLRRIMTTAQVCKLIGIAENGNHWRGWPSGLDISADGSHMVFHLLWDAFAMNGDGSGLRLLTRYLNPEDRNLNLVRISGDGKRIATYHQVKGLEITDWQGGNSVIHARASNLIEGRSLQFSADGSNLAMGPGFWLFDGAGPKKVELGEWGSYGDHPMSDAWGGTLSADGKRAGVIVKYQGLQQLVIVDVNPVGVGAMSALSELTVSPSFILTDGTNQATASVRVSGNPPAVVGISGLRDGFRIPEWSQRPWGPEATPAPFQFY